MYLRLNKLSSSSSSSSHSLIHSLTNSSVASDYFESGGGGAKVHLCDFCASAASLNCSLAGVRIFPDLVVSERFSDEF